MPQPGVAASSLIRFGVFEFDSQAGELRKSGRKLKVDGQPLQVLQLLLEKPGVVITREELRQALWPSDTFVDFEHGVNSAVKRLRQALDDSAQTPRFIETLPRRGYRFIYPLETGSGESAERTVPSGNLRLAVPVIAGVALFAAVLVVNVVRAPTPADHGTKAASIKRLAVLPFENLTGDAEQEYVVDGVHEDLITALARIGGPDVIARTSVLQYKQQRKPIRRIAGELDVDGVLEGAVGRDGERWHVTAQLIDARSERHIWADSYDCGPGELGSLPGQVARAIAGRLHVTLTPQEEARLSSGLHVDPALYKAYSKGRHHLHKRTPAGMEKAIGYFREALDLDTTYAPAWAALGDAYLSLGSTVQAEGDVMAADANRRRLAEASLRRAAELDPALPAPHRTLGTMKFEEWDWEGGVREFELARRLDEGEPGLPRYLLAVGRFDEAVRSQRLRAERDPLNYSSQLDAGWTAFMAGRYDEAIVALKRAIELDPGIPHAHRELAWSYVKKGLYNEAVAECERAAGLVGQGRSNAPAVPGGCEWVYAVAGRRHEALEMADRIEKRSSSPHRFIRLAHVHDALGERDQALVYLRKAFEAKAAGLPRQWYVPMLSDGIKADTRFQDLIRRTGNPWAKFPPAERQARAAGQPGQGSPQ